MTHIVITLGCDNNILGAVCCTSFGFLSWGRHERHKMQPLNSPSWERGGKTSRMLKGMKKWGPQRKGVSFHLCVPCPTLPKQGLFSSLPYHGKSWARRWTDVSSSIIATPPSKKKHKRELTLKNVRNIPMMSFRTDFDVKMVFLINQIIAFDSLLTE